MTSPVAMDALPSPPIQGISIDIIMATPSPPRGLKRSSSVLVEDSQQGLPPLSLVDPVQQCLNMLNEEFDRLLAGLDKAKFVGILGGRGGKSISMPLTSKDRRELTWTKLFAELKERIVRYHRPQSRNDCWYIMVKQDETSGYPKWNIAAHGRDNRHLVHRILHFVQNPGSLETVRKTGHQVAHRCGRGRVNKDDERRLACINPFHTTLASQRVNLDHNGCRRSAAAWCPHRPRCIFTSRSGEYQPCRNETPTLEYPCHCETSCYPEEDGSSQNPIYLTPEDAGK